MFCVLFVLWLYAVVVVLLGIWVACSIACQRGCVKVGAGVADVPVVTVDREGGGPGGWPLAQVNKLIDRTVGSWTSLLASGEWVFCCGIKSQSKAQAGTPTRGQCVIIVL